MSPAPTVVSWMVRLKVSLGVRTRSWMWLGWDASVARRRRFACTGVRTWCMLATSCRTVLGRVKWSTTRLRNLALRGET
jgi:hypothetical protein